MLSRALMLATVMLSILAAAPDAEAQNLDAGKSASQIFSSTCTACHKSQRGLLKTVQPGSLPGFLREHYTTSREMAGQLSAYLLSNGATDPRGAGGLTKQGQSAKSGGQGEPLPAEPSGRRQRPGQNQDAARPDGDGLAPVDPRTGRPKRNRAEQQPALGPDGQPVDPAQARQKQKMGKKKGRDEAPKTTPAPVDVAKPDASKPDATPGDMPQPPEPAPVVIDPKIDAPKSEPTRPNGNAFEPTPLRSDPVPQVTPAPRSVETESRPAAVPNEPSAPPPAAAPEPSEAPSRPTISVTPPPPPAPPSSGPPVPPISQ